MRYMVLRINVLLKWKWNNIVSLLPIKKIHPADFRRRTTPSINKEMRMKSKIAFVLAVIIAGLAFIAGAEAA